MYRVNKRDWPHLSYSMIQSYKPFNTFFILLSLTLVADVFTLFEWIISIKSITLWKLQMFTIKVLPLILHMGWLCTVGVQIGNKRGRKKIKFTWAERMERRMDGVYKIRDAYLCVHTWKYIVFSTLTTACYVGHTH